MTTMLITCPNCGDYVRAAVQPSEITVEENCMYVTFDSQTVAHHCNEEKK